MGLVQARLAKGGKTTLKGGKNKKKGGKIRQKLIAYKGYFMKKDRKKVNTFSLCAFYDYEVEYFCKYCYLNEDRDFVNREIKDSFKIDGGRLMNNLAKLILDSNCTEFILLENQIIISHFDPHSGETSDYDYKIKETGDHVFDVVPKEKNKIIKCKK